MLYPPNHLSVRPSVSASFPDSNLNRFWPIFFKLCMDFNFREKWFGVANGLNSFINNRVIALDWCKNGFSLNIFRTFCICIDTYKIHVVSNARSFWSTFNRIMAWSTSEFCLCSISCESVCGFPMCINIWYWQVVDFDDWTIFFVHFQKS